MIKGSYGATATYALIAKRKREYIKKRTPQYHKEMSANERAVSLNKSRMLGKLIKPKDRKAPPSLNLSDWEVTGDRKGRASSIHNSRS